MLNSLLHTHPNDPTDLDKPYLSWAPHDPIAIIHQPEVAPDQAKPHETRDRAQEFPAQVQELPAQVQDFLAMTAATHRNRDPVPLPPYSVETIGMSPKKAHEVARMVAYLKHVYLPALQGKGKVGIVDVGSGQGYLCRAMASELGLNVLGLDGNQVQTDGAEMWSDGRRGKKRSVNKAGGKVKYKTMRIDKATDIVDAVGEWLGPIQDSDSSPHQVVLVALHACGSLTPHIIRACLGTTPANRAWSFAGAVAVGCCYNLLNDSGASPPLKLSSTSRQRHSICRLPTVANLQIAHEQTRPAPRPRSPKPAHMRLPPSNSNSPPMERHSRNPA